MEPTSNRPIGKVPTEMKVFAAHANGQKRPRGDLDPIRLCRCRPQEVHPLRTHPRIEHPDNRRTYHRLRIWGQPQCLLDVRGASHLQSRKESLSMKHGVGIHPQGYAKYLMRWKAPRFHPRRRVYQGATVLHQGAGRRNPIADLP